MQSVLIIRANRGVGFAFAKAYLEQGSQVFAAYRNAATSRRLLELEHPNLVPLPLEVIEGLNTSHNGQCLLPNGSVFDW